MAATDQHGAAEAAAAREAVDPGDRIAVALVLLVHERHQLVEVGAALRVGPDAAGLDRQQLQGRLGDDAREAEAARGRPELVGSVVGCQAEVLAGRGAQLHGQDVVAEAAVAVVVLAVDVAGDRSADGDVARAGRDRHEPSEGHDQSHQRVEVEAGVDGDGARA